MSEENLAASEKELSDAVDEVLNEATVEVDEVDNSALRLKFPPAVRSG